MLVISNKINNWEILPLTPGVSEEDIRWFISGTGWTLTDTGPWWRDGINYYILENNASLMRVETGMLLARRPTLGNPLFEAIHQSTPIGIVLEKLR